jgi:uncharacterized protein
MIPISPVPTDPSHERYSVKPFPKYRFVPGRFPHPRRNPDGHSYGHPEPLVREFSASTWLNSDIYLYGVDLYNFAFWWECHEQWEAIWKFNGPDSYEGRFLQGMVQVAAANLRKFMGSHDSGAALAQKGISRLRDFEDDVFLGVNVVTFIESTERHFSLPNEPASIIDIHFPACSIDFSTGH